jgi:hypothetical protein
MRYMRGSHGVFNDKERGGAGQLVLALQYWSAFKRCDFRSFVARVPSVDCCWCFSNVVFSRVPVIRNNNAGSGISLGRNLLVRSSGNYLYCMVYTRYNYYRITVSTEQ